MFRTRSTDATALLISQLYDQDTFYHAFLKDVSRCRQELILESPFITSRRIEVLMPVFRKLTNKRVRIVINTRNPEEHNDAYQLQAEKAVAAMQALDIKVLYTAGHHRKIAVIDKQIMWEGSLNILSHNDSCEMMRRTVSESMAREMLLFTGVHKYVA